jgi:hypothetical protein
MIKILSHGTNELPMRRSGAMAACASRTSANLAEINLAEIAERSRLRSDRLVHRYETKHRFDRGVTPGLLLLSAF